MKKQPHCYRDRYTLVRMSNFGDWLRDHRRKLGLLQRDVAKRSGVSVSYISTIERGQPHSITGAELRPEPDKVKAIAKAVAGDVNEALQLAGYAPTNTIRKPQTIPELIAALESLGIEPPQLYGGYTQDPELSYIPTH